MDLYYLFMRDIFTNKLLIKMNVNLKLYYQENLSYLVSRRLVCILEFRIK